MNLAAQRRAAFEDVQNNGGNFQEAMQKLAPAMEKGSADALVLLTPDQKKTYDALKSRHENYAGLGPRSSMALLLVDGISEEQTGKLKALGTEVLSSLKGIAAAGGGNPLEEVRKAFSEAEEKVRKILTADQIQQFDETLKKIPAQLGRPNAAAQ